MSLTATRHFIDLWQHSHDELRMLLDAAHARKAARRGMPKGATDADSPLSGRVLAMVFEKHSTRTRASFEAAMRQLGGQASIYSANDLQLGRGESVPDTARVLSRFVDCIMLRTKAHATLVEFATWASVPVINGLTDKSHPCQILADLMTIEEKLHRLDGLTLAWIGDGNNVLNSFLHAAPKLGFTLKVAAPAAYAPKPEELARAEGAAILVEDPRAAAENADVIITDSWVSMGDTDEAERKAAFAPFQVNAALMGLAQPHALFLHCLPAHRDEEVTAEVLDGPQSVVWDEAENRLHAQKAVLAWCFGV